MSHISYHNLYFKLTNWHETPLDCQTICVHVCMYVNIYRCRVWVCDHADLISFIYYVADIHTYIHISSSRTMARLHWTAKQHAYTYVCLCLCVNIVVRVRALRLVSFPSATRICMHIHKHTYIYIYIYTCIYIYIYIYTYIHT